MTEDNLPYRLLSDSEQFLRCGEQTDYTKRIKRPEAITGYFVKEVEEMILKLRKEGYSTNSKEIRKEAIRRCKRILE
jgi:hypothetical protein